MSLLMKALEKAAKDRVEAREQKNAPAPGAAAPPAPAAGAPELSLEPIREPAALAAEVRAEPAPARAAAKPAAAREREQARAATVLQAGGRDGGVIAYLRTHPLMVFGGLAVLCGIGFGIYVYLQITNPGLFVRQPPRPPGPVAQSAPPPAPAAPPPLPAASVLTPPGAPEPGATAPAPAPAPRAAAPAPAAPAAPAPETPRNTITVSRGSAEPKLNPLLVDAYAALESGRLDVAQRLYAQLQRSEPASIDALLGLAAIAVQENRAEEATRHYLRILELDPRNALAQSGLIALLGRADPLAAESRLKQLIAREPSAFLHFTLGNLYADQAQWAQAQQSYFQAHHLEPANPDYAYNLAVGLEHLGQHKLALGFYRRAVQLAQVRGRVHFSLPQAQDRIAKLAAQVE
jgi:Flp pilus assembly protein TadD